MLLAKVIHKNVQFLSQAEQKTVKGGTEDTIIAVDLTEM